MTALRIVALIILCLVALAALLFAFPSLKEGYGTEELPLFSGLAGGLALCGFAWWWLCGRRDSKLFRAGLLVVGLPFATYSYLSGKTLYDELIGRQMARSLSISNYREQPIVGPGFDGPVGLAIEFDAQHSIDRSGNLYSPVIAMVPQLSYALYFRDYSRAQLMTPIMQQRTLPSLNVSPTHFRYELYPSPVQRVMDGRLCIKEQKYMPPSLQPHIGESLSGGWFLAAHSGAIADFSPQLSEAVRSGSSLQGKPDEWRRMFARVSPEGLTAAGYRPCEQQKPGWNDVCYCR